MPASSTRLTKRAIDALKPSPRRAEVWDSDLPGFGLRIEPSGTKTFVVRFRPKGSGRAGPKRFMSIGRFGPVTPEQARSAARDVLGRVARGEDPAEVQRAAREAPTVADLAERFLDDQVWPKKKASTAALYEHYLRQHVLPTLGNRKAASIKHGDIVKLHGAIGKTTPTTANRTAAVLSAMFGFGAKVGDLPDGANPVRGVEHFREQARQRFLSEVELARLGDALALAETDGLPYEVDEAGPKAKHASRPENRRRRLDPFAVAAVRLLLLTGARLREILHAQWTHFDGDRGLLLLPDSKSGAKPIFLGAAALAVIASLPRLDGNPFMFPGEGRRDAKGDVQPSPRADLKKPWAALCKAAGLPDLRLHDLRHTFASYGAGASLGLPMIGKLLGHSQPTTTQRYAHLSDTAMHRAVDTIGATIAGAMERRPEAKVVPIRRQA